MEYENNNYANVLKQCETSIQTFNELFKNPERKNKKNKNHIRILIIAFVLEIIWFLLVASKIIPIKISIFGLWFPMIALFAIAVLIMFGNDEPQKNILHLRWLRKKILPILYPEFEYVYENKTDIGEKLLAFYKSHVDSNVKNIHYFGCLMDETTDIYEMAIYDKDNVPSFYGICILLSDLHIEDGSFFEHEMETIEKKYYSIKNIEEGFYVVYKNGDYWLFFSEISFDNFMDDMCKNQLVPTIRPIDKKELEENFYFITDIQAIIKNITKK